MLTFVLNINTHVASWATLARMKGSRQQLFLELAKSGALSIKPSKYRGVSAPKGLAHSRRTWRSFPSKTT